jgi:hypothetical protein
MLFHYADDGLLNVPIEVLPQVAAVTGYSLDGKPVAEHPDIALLRIKARGLPALRISDVEAEEGMELATAGFPMGDLAFAPSGFLLQVSPTLQSGVVSAVLPFAQEKPEGFALNVMALGGASGSPVFHPGTGVVMGVLYGGLRDFVRTRNGDLFPVATNISYIVHGQLLRRMLAGAITAPGFKVDVELPTFADLLKNLPVTPLGREGMKPTRHEPK